MSCNYVALTLNYINTKYEVTLPVPNLSKYYENL